MDPDNNLEAEKDWVAKPTTTQVRAVIRKLEEHGPLCESQLSIETRFSLDTVMLVLKHLIDLDVVEQAKVESNNVLLGYLYFIKPEVT